MPFLIENGAEIRPLEMGRKSPESPNFDAHENYVFYSTDVSMDTLSTWELVQEQSGKISDCYMG